MNEGLPFADWSIVVQYEDANTASRATATTLKPGESGEFDLWHDGRYEDANTASRATATTLKPGESGEFDLWHDGRALMIRELPK
jgi:hypothetical protein